MTPQKPITLRTLGDLKANSMGLNATCLACGHRRDLNLDDLIRRLGSDFEFVGEEGNRLDARLRCTACDEKRGKAQLHNLRAGKSQIAD